ncbi:hypothetical protein NQZ79_g1382 [Umbelopsis isabellina]|nr:hypothetical protein NQZ79_g1382 [Umbelopsis isabellina]
MTAFVTLCVRSGLFESSDNDLILFTLLFSLIMTMLSRLQFPIHFPVANPYSLMVGTFLIHATSIAAHAGLPGQYWTAAMAKDKNKENWLDKSEFKRYQGLILLFEAVFGFIQVNYKSTAIASILQAQSDPNLRHP